MSATQTLLNDSLQYGAGSLTSHQGSTAAENSRKFLLALSQNEAANLKYRDVVQIHLKSPQKLQHAPPVPPCSPNSKTP